jgi:hypothetical protein
MQMDLSALGPLSLEQARAAMDLIQGQADNLVGQPDLSAFRKIPTGKNGAPLFNEQQWSALTEIGTKFAQDTHNLINKMHREVMAQDGPKQRVVTLNN